MPDGRGDVGVRRHDPSPTGHPSPAARRHPRRYRRQGRARGRARRLRGRHLRTLRLRRGQPTAPCRHRRPRRTTPRRARAQARVACATWRPTRPGSTSRPSGSGPGGSGPARRPAAEPGGRWSSPTSPSRRTGSRPPCASATTTATRRTGSASTGTRAGPRTTSNLIELVAVTDDAHLALWHTLLGIDLVAIITSRRAFAIDDALYLAVDNPRLVSTEAIDDFVWLRPHQPDGTARRPHLRERGPSRRWSSSRTRRTPPMPCRRAGRSRAVLTAPPRSGRGAGPISCSTEPVRCHLPGRLPTRRSWPGSRLITEADARRSLRRADAFFAAERMPHSQNRF